MLVAVRLPDWAEKSAVHQVSTRRLAQEALVSRGLVSADELLMREALPAAERGAQAGLAVFDVSPETYR